MTIQQALFYASKKLKKIVSTKREAYATAESLLLHVLSTTRENLYIINRDLLPAAKLKSFNTAIAKRLRHVPIQYITGKAWFYGREFSVRPGVLIPRPDTESVVEAFLRYIPMSENMTVAELGSGAGIIPVTLALERLDIKFIYSYDINPLAVKLSRLNSGAFNAGNRLRFVKGDFFKAARKQKFDVIVSNPPYISPAGMKSLSKEVLKEPLNALRGGKAGIAYYKKFNEYAKILLKKNGYYIFEAGDGMGNNIRKIFSGPQWNYIASVNDCRGLERAYVFRYLL